MSNTLYVIDILMLNVFCTLVHFQSNDTSHHDTSNNFLILPVYRTDGPTWPTWPDVRTWQCDTYKWSKPQDTGGGVSFTGWGEQLIVPCVHSEPFLASQLKRYTYIPVVYGLCMYYLWLQSAMLSVFDQPLYVSTLASTPHSAGVDCDSVGHYTITQQYFLMATLSQKKETLPGKLLQNVNLARFFWLMLTEKAIEACDLHGLEKWKHLLCTAHHNVALSETGI